MTEPDLRTPEQAVAFLGLLKNTLQTIGVSDCDMVVMLNDDRPGIIGRVGTAFGEDGVNIANMSVSRNFRGERAAMVLALDVTPAPSVIEHLSALDGVHHVRSVDLDGAGA